jgi:hypothetical protein
MARVEGLHQNLVDSGNPCSEDIFYATTDITDENGQKTPFGMPLGFVAEILKILHPSSMLYQRGNLGMFSNPRETTLVLEKWCWEKIIFWRISLNLLSFGLTFKMWNLIKMLMARYVGSSQPIGNIRPSPLRK